VVNKHPLRNLVRELYGRGQCEEVALELLTEPEVEEYLRQRLGQSVALTELSQLIYHRTNGNALFVVSFVDSLLQQRLLVEADGQVQIQADRVSLKRLMPHSLQQAILRQIERLAVDEQQLLKVASVGGMTFTAAEVAGVLGRALEEVEEKYDHLATQEGVLAIAGIAEEPDEAVTARYEFRHALYQQVMYEQLGHGRRVRLHRQLGEWQEARYGERATEIASALALHFTQGREYRKAAQYHCQAAETALRRSAYRETMIHCRAGLDLLRRLPDTSECQRQELSLRMLLSAALTATQGHGTEEVVQNLIRARELCQLLNDDTTQVSVLVGLGRAYKERADREAKEQVIDEAHRLLERIQEPALAIQLHTYLGGDRLWSGKVVRAQEHYDRVLALYDRQKHRELVLHLGMDPAVVASVLSPVSLWLTGWPDQARSRLKRGLDLARELDSAFTLSFALAAATHVQFLSGDLNEAERLAAEVVSVAHEHGVARFLVDAGILQACIHVQLGKIESSPGLSLLTEGLAQYRVSGAPDVLSLFLSFIADAYRQLGCVDEGLGTIAEALRVTETDSVYWAAELHRLKGELTLQKSKTSLEQVQGKSRASPKQASSRSRTGQGKFRVTDPRPQIPDPQGEAEACFHKAIEIAKQQEAKSLELRSAMSLSRLWQQQGKRKEARTLLREIYGWFREGFDTKDLREAKELLDALRA
jgi:tetratricopeptide (TPR) repeat protein